MDADAVASGIEQAHKEISILQYNDENSLSCTINLAFYFAREYYTVVRENCRREKVSQMFALYQRRLYVDKPAVVMELEMG